MAETVVDQLEIDPLATPYKQDVACSSPVPPITIPTNEEDQMARKVLINLATGLEDAERVTVAFLVGGAALERGAPVAMWLTKEAVRLALPGHAEAIACDGCPPLARLVEQFASGGGELLVCPICFKARKLDEGALAPNARIAGATPMLDWIGDDEVTVFSY
jgi:predicted peroxiredoxin